MYKYFNTKTKFENFTTKTYNGLPLVCFWLLGLNITGFVIKIIFTLIFGLIFIAFIIYFIFIFNILPIFIFYCFVFFAIIFLTIIFVNLLHVFRNIVNLFYMLTLTNIFFNWDSFHARLNSHCKACTYKKKKHKKIKADRKLF